MNKFSRDHCFKLETFNGLKSYFSHFSSLAPLNGTALKNALETQAFLLVSPRFFPLPHAFCIT